MLVIQHTETEGPILTIIVRFNREMKHVQARN